MRHLILLVMLLVPACVDDRGDETPSPDVLERQVFVDTSEVGGLDCSMVIPTDGPCASACDPDALASQIPEGTCAAFACQLTDGREIRVGGCN